MTVDQLLVDALGEENLVTLDPEDAELLGLSAADTETLVNHGLPADAGPLFTVDVAGDPGMFTGQRVTTREGEPNIVLFIGGPGNRPELRYFLDVRNGFVVLCSVDDGNPRHEVVNSSLAVFAEFLLWFAVYYQSPNSSPADEYRAVEELAGQLRERDPYALRHPGTWWSIVLEGLRQAIADES